MQYICFYRKNKKRKEKEKDLHGLDLAHNKAGSLQGIIHVEKETYTRSNLNILHQNPDIFQNLLRSFHLFFLSSIFTSRTLYFFPFSFILQICVSNETKTEPVIGKEEEKKYMVEILAFYY